MQVVLYTGNGNVSKSNMSYLQNVKQFLKLQ